MTGAVTAEPSKAPAGVNGGLISTSYRFSTSTVDGDPGSGRFRYDNAVHGLVSEIFIDSINNAGVDVSNFLTQIAAGDRLYIQQENDASRFAVWNVTVDAIDETGWFSIGVSLDADGDTLANNARSLFVWQIEGANFVTKVGTPVDNQVAVFTGPNSIEGDPFFDWNGERLRIDSDVITPLNNLGLELHNTNSVINTDGWILIPGVPGIFDGELIVSDEPTDVVANLNVRFVKNNATVFDIGARVADGSSFGSGTAGALAFFMPHDITGRVETKISFVGVVGGTGNEGVFSIEGFAYGDAGLQFHRLAHFVIDSDYRLRLENLGIVSAAGEVLAGDPSCMGFSSDDGLQLTGQGAVRDVTIYNDAKERVFGIPTGTTRVNLEGTLSVGAGHFNLPVYTDAQLDDITDAVNTSDDKVAGSMVFNSDAGHAVTSQGAADGSVWNDGVGTLTNTPV